MIYSSTRNIHAYCINRTRAGRERASDNKRAAPKRCMHGGRCAPWCDDAPEDKIRLCAHILLPDWTWQPRTTQQREGVTKQNHRSFSVIYSSGKIILPEWELRSLCCNWVKVKEQRHMQALISSQKARALWVCQGREISVQAHWLDG
jgi:hypothetical protein